MLKRNKIQSLRVKAWATFLSFVFVIVLLLPVSPWSPNNEKAEAAAAITYDLGDCAMRIGNGAAIDEANSFCFIDFTGLISAPNQTKTYTRKIGDMTLQFDLSWTTSGLGSPSVTAVSSQWDSTASFGQTNGYRTFIPYSGDAQSPIVKTSHWPTNYYFNFSNIKLTDSSGKQLSYFKLNVLDAEISPGTESWSITDNDTTTNKTTLNKVVQPGFADPCNYTRYSNRDFYCQGYRTSETIKGIAVATIDSPTQFQIEKYAGVGAWNGFALAISIGRVAGKATADTSYEMAETGQATSFDHQMFSRVGTTDTLIPKTNDGTFSVYNRPYSSTLTPQDTQVFTSTASGADAQYAHDRYNPVWTCNAGNNAPVTIEEGKPFPSGYDLTYDSATHRSILRAVNINDEPLDCSVDWKSRFQPSVLNLRKTLDGNAASFNEISGRTFELNYVCSNDSFAQAYPSIPLSGKATVKAGESKSITNLPFGTSCKMSETFPSGIQATPPGINLNLTWKGGTQDTATLPNLNTTLATTSDVSANNNYTYRAGSLSLSKSLLGDPVSEFAYPRHYDFSLTCVGTTVQNKTIGFDINPSGTVYSGSVNITDIPVEHECQLTPLTGLSSAESKKYTFVGRTVTIDGTSVTKNSDGSYSFKLADYPQGGTPTASAMHIDATYAYQLRDVKVIKQYAGPAAGSNDLIGKTFPVQYKCTWGSSGQYSLAGSLNITTDTSNPSLIKGVPVDASCLIYEDAVPENPNTILTGTKLAFTDANDVTVVKTNDDAKTQPIMKVSAALDSSQNRVLVTNTYDYKLGTVDLSKIVNKNGITVSLPTSFSINFDCGTRTVVNSDGSTSSVPLVGNVAISEGQTLKLKAQVTDSVLDPKVNDQSGYMGVPYANTCTFSEDVPQISTSGVLWSSDVEAQKFTVSAPNTAKTITNTFTAAGNGLTIQSRVVSWNNLALPVNLNVACKDSNGTPLVLEPRYSTVSLSKTTPSVTIPASQIPEGSSCTVVEPSADPGTRQATSGNTYPISRSVGMHVAATQTDPELNLMYGNLAQINASSIKIGSATVVEMNFYYAYVSSSISASKVVAFDPATQQYISDARKEIKRNREFSVSLECLYPDGVTEFTASGTIVSTKPAINLGELPVGSTCSISEGATTTATGIDVKQQISVNNGSVSDVTANFTVQKDSNSAVITNTYSRRLAPVVLNKRAVLPGSIRDQYSASGVEIPLHTHQFSMDCHDPETGDGSAGALLGTFNGTITGEGTYQFDSIPVGVDCHIAGDHFGPLNLNLTNPDGTQLQAYLKPKQVKWVVDKNDGTAVIDTTFPNDVTESNYFNTLDNGSDGSISNIVDIENTYEYIMTPVKMSKAVEGSIEDLALLSENQQFEFSYQCQAVGYSSSSMGQPGATLPTLLNYSQLSISTSDTPGKQTNSFVSDQAMVPAGSLCTVKESAPVGTPSQLEWKVDQQTITKRVENTTATQSWDFVNHYTRRMVPVRVSTMHAGYIEGAIKDSSGLGYTYTVTCNDPAKTSITNTVLFNNALVVSSVASQGAPGSGEVLQLPAGSDCSINYGGSASLAPSAQLEVTAGSRSPFMRFGTWTATGPDASNPTQNWRDIAPNSVTTDMKSYSRSFTIAPDLTTTSDVAMTVGAQAVYLQDTVDVSVTKTSYGAVADGSSFTFGSDCLADGITHTIKAGESFTIKGVPVNRVCIINEISQTASVAPQLGVDAQGDGIVDAVATNTPATDTEPAKHYSQFTVAPVTDPNDLSQSGSYWSLTLANRYPAIDIEKTIDGALLPAGDSVVLNPYATSMVVHYALTNNGGLPVDTFSLKDPSLAGRTITKDGQTLVVGSDGTIDPMFCGIDNANGYTMQPNEALTCTFTVQLDEPQQSLVDVKGAVTVSAFANGLPVSDSDSFGAQRVWMSLPQAGAISLVVVILTGVGVVVYGLWKNRDDDDDDSATTSDL
ncbi:DUF5979 domain-containing protein [Arcanobacterium ihumii]|uniref:DUF5979 domain-containing protein n=1 Tax=Arcanobacterium ihumii TaxID=2138162 RepID=UPI000F5410F9|nr:DUF5979 domain-containing protein [Arcanobacterium ihumii]